MGDDTGTLIEALFEGLVEGKGWKEAKANLVCLLMDFPESLRGRFGTGLEMQLTWDAESNYLCFRAVMDGVSLPQGEHRRILRRKIAVEEKSSPFRISWGTDTSYLVLTYGWYVPERIPLLLLESAVLTINNQVAFELANFQHELSLELKGEKPATVDEADDGIGVPKNNLAV